MYQPGACNPVRCLQPPCSLNGRIAANHKQMNSELDMIFSSHLAKQVDVLMKVITQF